MARWLDAAREPQTIATPASPERLGASRRPDPTGGYQGESMLDLTERLHRAAAVGMTASVWAQEKPDTLAIHDPHGTRSFFALNANANRIVRLLRAHGFRPGDSVALLCSNRAEFVEVLCATLRGGYRF